MATSKFKVNYDRLNKRKYVGCIDYGYLEGDAVYVLSTLAKEIKDAKTSFLRDLPSAVVQNIKLESTGGELDIYILYKETDDEYAERIKEEEAKLKEIEEKEEYKKKQAEILSNKKNDILTKIKKDSNYSKEEIELIIKSLGELIKKK